eukprot:Clim_evm25s240 gene=Clim_evmTU25s240
MLKRVQKACVSGDLDTLQKCLVEVQETEGNKGPVWASEGLDGADTPALVLAVRHGHFEIAKWLVDQCLAPLDRGDSDGRRPLHEACSTGRPEIVKWLIGESKKQGFAMIDMLKRADWTPLMLACASREPGSSRCAEILLEAGADATLRNKDGWDALHIAIREPGNSLSLLARLPMARDMGAGNGRTYFHTACLHGRVRALILLILRSVAGEWRDCMQRDNSGCNPLHDCAAAGHLGCAGVMLVWWWLRSRCGLISFKHCADMVSATVESFTDKYGRTPLHVACRANGQRTHAPLPTGDLDGHVDLTFPFRITELLSAYIGRIKESEAVDEAIMALLEREIPEADEPKDYGIRLYAALSLWSVYCLKDACQSDLAPGQIWITDEGGCSREKVGFKALGARAADLFLHRDQGGNTLLHIAALFDNEAAYSKVLPWLGTRIAEIDAGSDKSVIVRLREAKNRRGQTAAQVWRDRNER